MTATRTDSSLPLPSSLFSPTKPIFGQTPNDWTMRKRGCPKSGKGEKSTDLGWLSRSDKEGTVDGRHSLLRLSASCLNFSKNCSLVMQLIVLLRHGVLLPFSVGLTRRGTCFLFQFPSKDGCSDVHFRLSDERAVRTTKVGGCLHHEFLVLALLSRQRRRLLASRSSSFAWTDRQARIDSSSLPARQRDFTIHLVVERHFFYLPKRKRIGCNGESLKEIACSGSSCLCSSLCLPLPAVSSFVCHRSVHCPSASVEPFGIFHIPAPMREIFFGVS